MQNWNGIEGDELRVQGAELVGGWCPSELKGVTNRQRWEVVNPWFLILSGRGWVAPGWPSEYGGMGLSPAKHMIYIEEYEKCGAPRLLDQALTNLGPILIARGTDGQRNEYLPRILRGESVWCQGYSEPNAGSDLASLRTEGRVEGETIIINGHKIWTSMAFDATHMFALVRTDKAAKKQAGITFVMFEMDQPGIEVRPIRDIAGSEEFCEVFLTDVRAQMRNVVGDVTGGWGSAETLRGLGRVWAGSPRQSLVALGMLERVARQMGIFDDPVFQDKFVQLTFDVTDLAATYGRSVRMLEAGGGFGFQASPLKIIATETMPPVTELLLAH